jgi:two-component system response regulator YesN
MLEILIVDDEPEIRRFAKGALPTSSVREAADGEEALAAIGKRRPDLVVTDIRMPQMDGYTLFPSTRAVSRSTGSGHFRIR